MKLKLLTLSLILLLGGVLQTIPAHGGAPSRDRSQNPIHIPPAAVCLPDARDMFHDPGECDRLQRSDIHGSVSHKPGSAHSQLTGTYDVRHPEGLFLRSHYTADSSHVILGRRRSHPGNIRPSEMVSRQHLGAMAQDTDIHLTKSLEIGGVLYCTGGRRWLPDGRGEATHRRAAEIHDDRRPGIPRNCVRHEYMFGTGILSDTRTVDSKCSDRGISLRDSYCQTDWIVSYTRVCPTQQILNCLKIPNSEQSIYSRQFYGLAGLGLGLIPGKEVRHV